MKIEFAGSTKAITYCYPVMAELRPHITLENFVEQVIRMQENHQYQLVYLEDEGVKSVAGIRIAEWLYAGKYLEIDDLVTTAEARSKGYGGILFDWVRNYAKEMQCDQVRLLSGVQREHAHRFYLNKGMKFEAKYFSLNL
ncbi:MAG: GNAT family N-acetyltransferase [Cellvibrio sp. 79]|nr:MAG: GNAT family N-acetyltransferase [Cellvibrio sp. 79]